MTRLIVQVFDVEHGACSILEGPNSALAMVDSGDNTTTGWRPSRFIKRDLGRDKLDYLIVTNADQDHLSDLEGLWSEQVAVSTLIRNRQVSPAQLRAIKEEQGDLTQDIERFLDIHETYNQPAAVPFDAGMGGATINTFNNVYPEFSDTNNLSLCAFVNFGPFKMCFPGDLETPGWRKLLEDPNFTAQLRATTILMASHHGRESGFCPDVFEHCSPLAVVISDKPIVHTTQEMVPQYQNVVRGVSVQGTAGLRHVLTTRRDGNIRFAIGSDGSFDVFTGV